MKLNPYLVGAALMLTAGPALAQAELNTYADADGNIDVQKLTCAQLAGTFQEDADFMSIWYSGWYNGLANAGKINVDRAKELEHRVIVYCKANRSARVISAIDVVIKGYRKEKGIRVKDEE
jgi:HdeA/HdeB family